MPAVFVLSAFLQASHDTAKGDAHLLEREQVGRAREQKPIAKGVSFTVSMRRSKKRKERSATTKALTNPARLHELAVPVLSGAQ